MAGTSMNSASARRLTTYAQLSGVALLVAAGGLWALDISGLKEPPAKPEPRAEAPRQQGDGEQGQAAVVLDQEELVAVADRLNFWRPKTPMQEEQVQPEQQPEVSVAAWAFHGMIQESDRTLAVVNVDGRQRILPEGRQYGESKLVKVQPHQIVLERNGVLRNVMLSEREGPPVAWVRNMGVGAPAQAAGQAAAGVRGGGQQLSPEVRQRLLERGVDPGQMERMRQLREQEQGGRNRAQPQGGRGGGGGAGNGNGGPVNGRRGNAANDADTSSRGDRSEDADASPPPRADR